MKRYRTSSIKANKLSFTTLYALGIFEIVFSLVRPLKVTLPVEIMNKTIYDFLKMKKMF